MVILKQLNFLVQAIEKKEKQNNELLVKNREYTAEITELKRTKKLSQEENIKLTKDLVYIKNRVFKVRKYSISCLT